MTSLKIPRDNQNSQIEEGQTEQWPIDKKTTIETTQYIVYIESCMYKSVLGKINKLQKKHYT